MNEYNTIEDTLSDIKRLNRKKFIIVTGGIGDFFTIDYFYSFSNTKNIIFISKQSLKLKNILNFYCKNNKFYALYFNFSLINKPGFDNNKELLNYFPQFKKVYKVHISDYFPLIRNIIQSKKYTNNYILYNSVNEDIKTKFNIPQNYAVIHPYTEDNRINCIQCNFIHKGISNCGLTRNFINVDYLNIFEFLKKQNITGVIISIEPIHLPNYIKGVNIINLSLDKLDVINCIELTKQCNYFFGVDSLFSVIASKILPPNNIYIKCNNNNGYCNRDIYWYPNENINLQSFINIKY